MQLYRRGADAAVDSDFSAAVYYADIRLGNTHIFWKQRLRTYYLPLSRITRAWHRIEGVASHVGCCATDFSIHRLMLVTDRGDILSLLIGDSLFRHEDEQLMHALRVALPDLPIGKPEA